jgi:poly-beta-1,6-N-acetyl-D-glucosamine biosynthesis protein PgaD
MNRRPHTLRRFTEYTLTTLFWLAWLYLILPLLSLLLWFAGVQLFMDVMVLEGGYQQLLTELRNYSLAGIVILLVVLVWVDWNIRHYGGHNHRTHPPQPVTPGELSSYTGLTTAELAVLRQKKNILLSFDVRDRPVIRHLPDA